MVKFTGSLLISCLCVVAAAAQERPTAMRIFPTETALFVRTGDVRTLRERFMATQMGKLFSDAEVSPLVENLYGEANRLYEEHASEKMGVGLGDLLKVAQGEVAFGLIALPRQNPEVLLLIDCGEEFGVAEKLLAKLEESAESLKVAIAREQLFQDEALVVRLANDQSKMVGLVRRGNVFLLSTNKDLLESALARWDGREIPPPAAPAETTTTAKTPPPPPYQTSLAENVRFATTMREVLEGRSEPPQLLGFVAPIELVRSVFAKNTGAMIALATLPALGLNGLHGLGGASWYSTEDWDGLTRMHLLLENPRAGVLKVVRFEPGDYTPPTFVPAACETFITTFVDPPRMLDDICSIVDKFRHKGYLREAMTNNISKNLGIDFETEVIGNLSGRLDIFTAYAEDSQIFTAHAVRAVSVRDPAAMQATLEKLAEKFPQMMRPVTFGELSYYQIGPERPAEEPPAEDDEPRRGPPSWLRPAMGLVGDSLLVTETEEMLQQAIAAHQETAPRLRDAITYKLIASRISRLSAGKQSAGAMYNDPAVTFKHYLSLANSDELRAFWDRFKPEDDAENPGVGQRFRSVLEATTLPSEEAVLKYLAPSGGVAYDTDNGLHVIMFSFRRDE